MANEVIFSFEENSSQRWADLFNVFVEVKINKNDSSCSHYLQFLKAIQKNNRKYVPIKLPFRRDGIIELVDLSDILFLEVSHRTIVIHCSGEDFETIGDLATQNERLCPYGFLRIHRRFLISTSRIRKFTYTYVTLDNGESLPIGKTYRKEVNENLKKTFFLNQKPSYSVRL